MHATKFHRMHDVRTTPRTIPWDRFPSNGNFFKPVEKDMVAVDIVLLEFLFSFFRVYEKK